MAASAVSRPVHPSELIDVARSLAGDVDDASRSGLLASTDDYDAWLVVWEPDQRSRHGEHDGSRAVTLVLEGELADIRSGDGYTMTWLAGAGEAVLVPPWTAHELVAVSGPAVSIHVCSPPSGAALQELLEARVGASR